MSAIGKNRYVASVFSLCWRARRVPAVLAVVGLILMFGWVTVAAPRGSDDASLGKKPTLFAPGPAVATPGGGGSASRQTVVWDNGMEYLGLAASQYDPGMDPVLDPIIADDFEFTQDQMVNDVHWIGGYWNGPPDDGDFDWEIIFYNDFGDGTKPGAAIATYTFANADVNETFIDGTPGGMNYYDYWVDLPSTLSFSAGTKYWISIQGIGAFQPQSGWGYHTDPILLHQAVFKSVYFGYPDWVNSEIAFGIAVDMCFQLTYTPGDEPTDIKWQQLPDEAGWDVNATYPVVLADDFMCTETGWIKDIHFWGSWRHGIEGQLWGFELSLHADIPANPPDIPYSMPGELLWWWWTEDFTIVPIDPPSMEGWYDPYTGEEYWNDHQAYFKYNVILPEEAWFPQEAGTIYWLNITAFPVDDVNTHWGWKSSVDHWNDDAVWALHGYWDWIDLWEPSITVYDDFYAFYDNGVIYEYSGSGYNFGEWYLYENTGWWNVWFYDHPYIPNAYKWGWIEFNVSNLIGNPFEVVVNWSTPEWSLYGNPPGEPRIPPLPPLTPEEEDMYIGRETIGWVYDVGLWGFPYTIPDYNPEWVSIDIAAWMPEQWIDFEGWIEHTCVSSLDLAFELTGGPDYKWVQWPELEPTGMDVSTSICWVCHEQEGYPPLGHKLADDFLCTETSSITEVHIWGSWYLDYLPFGYDATALDIYVSFHEDLPVGDPQNPYPWSIPGEELWGGFVPFTVALYADNLDEGWLFPDLEFPSYVPSADTECYKYVLTLPGEFIQVGTADEPVIYWIDIEAWPWDEELSWFGWKTSYNHWNDDAVWSGDWEPPGENWYELRYPDGHPYYGDSIDLAFGLIGVPVQGGACCYGTAFEQCVVTTQSGCDNLFGVYQGDGTQCLGMEACCLQDGSNDCIDADALCCVNELGGIAQGPGSFCGGWQACCLPNDTCVMADALCCVNELGGVPQGAFACTSLEACCLFDGLGTCIMVDPLCCDEAGGAPQGTGTSCSVSTIACCLSGGACADVDPLCCDDMGGFISPISGVCLGGQPDAACDLGGWEPGDGHKMHFPQLPDEDGWDVHSEFELCLADDFRCSETGPIKDIHFWGSWRNGVVGNIDHFDIFIMDDIPADQSPTGYSMPGDMVPNGGRQFYPDEWIEVPVDSSTYQGWYNPETGETLYNDHQDYFQYNIYLEEADWIPQVEDTIYWLFICAHTDGIGQWGWKSSENHFNDDAVWSTGTTQYWQELYEPALWASDWFEANYDFGYVYGYPEWYYYENSGWWNAWFYDHPYVRGYKWGFMHFDVWEYFPPGYPLPVVVNWSTDLWSLEGNPPGEPRIPPLPGLFDPAMEELYIGRQEIGFIDNPGPYDFEFYIPDYNPEWVSIDFPAWLDVYAYFEGWIDHACFASADLAFVITGGEDNCMSQGETQQDHDDWCCNPANYAAYSTPPVGLCHRNYCDPTDPNADPATGCVCVPILYGDVYPVPGGDGAAEGFDILCILDAANADPGFGCLDVLCTGLIAGDIYPCGTGDGAVEGFDILAVLDAANAIDWCPPTCVCP